jgi:DNA polymerase zeta
MPCVDIADSIVQTARDILERVWALYASALNQRFLIMLQAIQIIENNDLWKARVVYGDTDSLFVHLPGCSKSRAFEIGSEIADAVTASNKRPITLKFEKMYHPCFLLSKKRYVGFKYESATQNLPVFDAKGIETVRRDGCAAVSKILEKSLK